MRRSSRRHQWRWRRRLRRALRCSSETGLERARVSATARPHRGAWSAIGQVASVRHAPPRGFLMVDGSGRVGLAESERSTARSLRSGGPAANSCAACLRRWAEAVAQGCAVLVAQAPFPLLNNDIPRRRTGPSVLPVALISNDDAPRSRLHDDSRSLRGGRTFSPFSRRNGFVIEHRESRIGRPPHFLRRRVRA